MKKSVITIIVVGMLLLVGCESAHKDNRATTIPTQKSTMETLSIYSVDSDAMALMPVTVKKDKKKVTPEYITSLVEDCLDDENVRVYSVKQEKNKIILSFFKDGKPVKGCSENMEILILDCFANSLLDNIESCTEVVFRCEDKAYKSEHSSFKINEVYASE